MKLYYAQGACSFSPHIVLHELGLEHELVQVDLKTGQTSEGVHIREIHPKGYVPALMLDDGEVLTESSAISMYLGSLKPELGLMPQGSPIEQARVHEWMNYIGMELHKNFSGIFNPAATDAEKAAILPRLMKRYALVEKTLEKRPYLCGETFTVADAYLFTVTNWANLLGIDISSLTSLQAYMAKIMARESVVAAMQVEGICAN